MVTFEFIVRRVGGFRRRSDFEMEGTRTQNRRGACVVDVNEKDQENDTVLNFHKGIEKERERTFGQGEREVKKSSFNIQTLQTPRRSLNR